MRFCPHSRRPRQNHVSGFVQEAPAPQLADLLLVERRLKAEIELVEGSHGSFSGPVTIAPARRALRRAPTSQDRNSSRHSASRTFSWRPGPIGPPGRASTGFSPQADERNLQPFNVRHLAPPIAMVSPAASSRTSTDARFPSSGSRSCRRIFRRGVTVMSFWRFDANGSKALVSRLRSCSIHGTL